MKTSSVAKQYVDRIFGIHPVESKNMRPHRKIRTYRFCSETLPNEKGGEGSESGEKKNTVYPEFKKWLPPSLIKKDITIRNPVMTIRDPQGGPDIYVEFVSYGQTLQAQAGVQRASIWIDESASRSFYEESIPRLHISGGDLIYTLTPAQETMGWEFEDLFEKARTYIRTRNVVDRIKLRTGKDVPMIENNDSEKDIAVIMAATDDNPVYEYVVKEYNAERKKSYTVKEYLDKQHQEFSDESVIDIRRYGLFQQVSGRIFTDMDINVHSIDAATYFPDGIPHDWMMGRFIDFHEFNPWATVFIALSPSDEAYVFNEGNFSPERMVTMEICKRIAAMSRDYVFPVNLVDPRAAIKQPNSGMAVIEDMNRYFYEFKREKLGTGGYWQTWDTKSARGRDEIRRRLKNAKLVGKPFNNIVMEDGRTKTLPTLWIFNHCRETILSLKNWRKEEHANREALVTKDAKDKPQQKWSHFPMCLEAAFKHEGFRPRKKMEIPRRPQPKDTYFQGHRIHA